MTSSEPLTPPGAAPGPALAVVAGHGSFANGMISAVQQISGAGHRFHGVSNTALTPVALLEALRTAVLVTTARVIFTDLPAGSCTIAARRLAREQPGLQVVTGANLPILLTFAMGADFPEAIDRAVEKARVALGVPADPAAR